MANKSYPNQTPPCSSQRSQSVSGQAIALEVEALVSGLEKRIEKDREHLVARITAWANLLDTAGWCVALRLNDDANPWLGEQAKRWLTKNGGGIDIDSVTWDWFRLNLPPEQIMIRDQRVLLWSYLSEKAPKAPTESTESTDWGLTKLLTRRENEILNWMSFGKTNPEIAIILGRSARTIEKHVENIFRKTGVSSRNQLILRLKAYHSDS